MGAAALANLRTVISAAELTKHQLALMSAQSCAAMEHSNKVNNATTTILWMVMAAVVLASLSLDTPALDQTTLLLTLMSAFFRHIVATGLKRKMKNVILVQIMRRLYFATSACYTSTH